MSLNSMSQENIYPQARNDGRGVVHNVHDTWLTVVAQTCGAHQGAVGTSAGFEASGDLQMAGEK